jgi:hypothetical protein
MDQLPSVTVILFKVTLQPLFKFRSDFVHGVNPNTVSEFLYNLGATGPRDDKRRIEGRKDDLPRGFVHMGSGCCLVSNLVERRYVLNVLWLIEK